MGGHISGIVGGQIVTVTEAPLLTSNSTSWSGFLLETVSPNVVRQDVNWGWHRTHVNLITKGALSFRVRQAGREEAFVARAGNALVFPSGFGEARFSYDDSDFELICVELNPSLASRLLGRKGPAAEAALDPQMVIDDSRIAALVLGMQAEIIESCPTQELYAQSLSLALAAYLEARFSVNRPKERSDGRQFSHRQIRQLLDYINENLGSDLSLFELANLMQLSPRQFFRLFSNTFGSTPHRYVMNERVAQAKKLLSAGLTLVDIAHELGFSSQSHFTEVFRKIAGISPGRFRREHERAHVGKLPEYVSQASERTAGSSPRENSYNA